MVQIVVGAAVPVLAAAGATGWVTAAVAAVPVVAEGIQQLFQWHSTWLRCRSTAEALKTEKFLYATEAGPYADGTRSSLLAERITAITGKEADGWAESAAVGIGKQEES
ncbi:hypothetical protein NRB56_29690 [Nocardia sp. RB56]|uniref:DUF4231 domain-containing protein n=1 Tax=Nocardia aurantia TaxID=2585199 RepID=A0A7K0DNR2_9NOCA|nr:hypothetical protein [Nocardia aurantia]